MKKISVLCPSRGRPEIFLRMAKSARAMGTGRHEILLYLDRDDPVASQYTVSAPPDNLIDKVLMGAPVTVGRAWNQIAKESHGDFLMMANDDLVFVTEKWDQRIGEWLEVNGPEDEIFVAHVDDGASNPDSRCAFPIISRRWYECLEYFTPEYFHFLYHDTWIADIGKRLKRFLYISDVLIEHRHFAFKKSPCDQTYQRHRVGQVNAKKRQEDQRLFNELAGIRERDAGHLRALMKTNKFKSKAEGVG